MSSGSSGRYQSRLFNFVHQHSRRLTQQWEHTFRHLQVATKWGVELLLYPVYLLFQSSESARKTLQTKEPQPQLKPQANDTDFSSETPLTVDTPIQRVLSAVQHLSLEEAKAVSATTSAASNPLMFLQTLWWQVIYYRPTTDTSSTQSLTIPEQTAGSLSISQPQAALKYQLSLVRGIATNLVNRHLVLVTADNEILDILTLQQQSKLEDRIISEIANYWHSWRLAETQKQTQLLPEIDRLLAKLTGDSQTKISVLPEGTKLVTFLDTSFAKLEATAIVPVQQRSQKVILLAKTQLNTLLYGKEQLAAREEITVITDDLETQKLNLQALIEAALNYFFGVGAGHKLEPSNNQQSQRKSLSGRLSQALPKSKQLQNQDLIADPWLTLTDLFGNSDKVTDKSVIPAKNTKPALSASQFGGFSLPKNLTVKQPKADSGLVQKKKLTSNLTPTPKTSAKIASTKPTQKSIAKSVSTSHEGKISQQFPQSTQIEAKPDWIETDATSIGYEKHPLEQLLEWLDRAMLWLEEILEKIFQSLQSLWQGK